MIQKGTFGIERYRRPYLIDQGSGFRLVQYSAFPLERPHIIGYGMGIFEAIRDLIHNVQPLEEYEK